jgi:hypothetical protein
MPEQLIFRKRELIAMPNRDGRGPFGEGPATGGRFGRCGNRGQRRGQARQNVTNNFPEAAKIDNRRITPQQAEEALVKAQEEPAVTVRKEPAVAAQKEPAVTEQEAPAANNTVPVSQDENDQAEQPGQID